MRITTLTVELYLLYLKFQFHPNRLYILNFIIPFIPMIRIEYNFQFRPRLYIYIYISAGIIWLAFVLRKTSKQLS